MKGYFIAIEGADGVGKSTQVELLKKYFEDLDKSTVVIKELKVESSVSGKISDVLSRKENIDPYQLNELFAEHRRKILDDVIKPALSRGETVISDRYIFSSFAYGSLDCDIESIIDLNKDFPMPDVTILLMANPETCINRIKERKGDDLELYEEIDKLKKIHSNYRALLDRFPNIKIIDGDKSIEEVHKNIISLLESELNV